MGSHELQFLAGGGGMGARMRAMDWSRTPFGPPARWPSALKALVSLMLASNQPMFIAWGPDRALLYNDFYAPILGDKQSDALGRDFLEVWHEIRADLEPIVSAAYRGEPVQMPDIELWIQRHGYREETHFSFFYAPVRDEAGRVGGMFCACTEITAQVLAERRVLASKARYRGLLANMDEAFTLMDREFRFVEFNRAAIELLQRDEGELIGMTHWDAYPGSREWETGTMYRQVMADGRPRSIETEVLMPDGRRLWCEVRAYMAEDGLAVFFRDITRRRRTAEDAALAAERVQLALDAGAIVGTWVWTIPDNRFVADERFAQHFGLDPQRCREGLGLEEVVESIHPDDVARVGEAISEAMARGGAYRCEYRVRQYDGSYRWVEANGHVERDAGGTPLRFPGVLLDHGERRRVEAERDRADALLRTFTEAVPGVVYAKDREGRFLVANRGTAELLGLPPESFIGRTDADVLADADESAAIMANDRRVMASGVAEQVEEEVQLADGTPATWLSTKAPLRGDAGEVIGLIGASVDITERRRIEDALRLSEQRSALALEVAQIGIWILDLRTGAVASDARTRQICGLPADRETLTLDDVAQRVHPEDWPGVQSALERAQQPDGDGSYGEEFRWCHGDGQLVWAVSRAQVMFDGEGPARRATSMIGSVIDVTERRRMIEALQQADRRKDEFLAMLAHELRNPLAPIGTAAQLLEIAAGNEAQVRQAAQIIARQVGHMTEMVDDLLDVSRVTRGLVELDREPVDMRAVVSAAIEQVEPLIQARRHRLVTDSAAGGAVVTGDRKRLVQVLSNLLNNAAKYTAPEGRIELSLAVDGREVVIRVSDTGIGMDEALAPRVFDLFAQGERTPDRSQGGLGIGLALVRSIVQLHGGSVLASSPGANRGSTFVVRLPAAAGAAVNRPVPAVPGRAASGRRVLIVDDNRDAADTLSTLLSVLGHHAVVAGSATEALAVAATDPEWDAYILDIGMPDMTGYELAQRLRALPRTRPASFIALTGYGHEHDRVLSRAAGFDHHLVKPAGIDEIQALLARGAA